MLNSIGCSWDWIAFLVGLFGAFIMEFIRIIKANKTLTEVIKVGDNFINVGKVNKLAILITIGYIIIGGVISGIFANTLQEAFLYGIFWEALFTFVINSNGENKR